MGNINYFYSIVKILENPVHIQINNKISIITFRVKLFQIRRNCPNQIIVLVFWGKKSNKIKKYYKLNDYILIEGYLSIKNKSNISSSTNLKQIFINVLKTYSI